MATVGRKKNILTGRNRQQNQARGRAVIHHSWLGRAGGWQRNNSSNDRIEDIANRVCMLYTLNVQQDIRIFFLFFFLYILLLGAAQLYSDMHCGLTVSGFESNGGLVPF